jgi:hypothetical protein
MTYEVQTYTLCYGWVNIWSDSDSTLVTFDTLEQAQNELQDFLSEMAHAVQLGHLDDFSPEDYRIEEIAP